MKNKFIIIFCFFCMAVKAQSKWDKDLVVDYKMSDKDGSLMTHIEVKKDSIFYEWIEKNRHNVKKMGTDIEFENKILKAINDNKVLKFKSHKLAKNSVNMIFQYKKNSKTKTVIFPQPIKRGS